MFTSTKLIANILVLSGRGGATNSHLGNREFRLLVKQYQNSYLKAKKRDKPQVAAIVVEKIRKKGGRFLRRYATKGELFWVDIGDVRAREKTCQALREGAPEIRRRKAAFDKNSSRTLKDSIGSLSATSTFDRTESGNVNKLSRACHTQILRTSFEIEKKKAISIAGAPMVIRPSMTFLCGNPSDFHFAIQIDHLDKNQREIYLRDFLPPNPTIQNKELRVQATAVSADGNEDKRDELSIDIVGV